MVCLSLGEGPLIYITLTNHVPECEKGSSIFAIYITDGFIARYYFFISSAVKKYSRILILPGWQAIFLKLILLMLKKWAILCHNWGM